MIVSYSWLKKYVEIKLKPEELAQRLTMLGLEVERIEYLGTKYDQFIVGEVTKKEKHPNADRLTVCQVNVGKENLQIVCGAPNVTVGQKVAVGLVGVVIPRNQHDPKGAPSTLARTTIRGVESQGMICSPYELDLGDDADGIMVLEEKARPGTALAKYFGLTDAVFEVSVTPNRGDWLSHFGVAREIALAGGLKIRKPIPKLRESKTPAAQHITVKILDPEKCPRYSARLLRNVRVGPSPRWLQDALNFVGIRPINNIVDATNYVLMETGQPLHSFDYDKLSGKTIVVKVARAGDAFKTLDDKERRLNDETLMICDAERPVAIAGVMGGSNSEISEQTTSVLIESANFDPRNIRRTSRFLGLSTDASQRFERGVDIDVTLYAANRVSQIIQEMTGAEVLKGVVDAYPKKIRPRKLKVRIPRVNAILGTNFTRAQVVALLKPLEITSVSSAKDSVVFQIPTFRTDIVEEIDVIEEVARSFGYDEIATQTRAAIEFSEKVQVETTSEKVRDYLVGAGFHEIMTLSLQERNVAQLPGEPAIDILNPVSAEMATLRTSLVLGALSVVQRNISHGEKDLRIFEIGHTFQRHSTDKIDSLAQRVEEERLLIAISGHARAMRYDDLERPVDFFDLKGEVKSLLTKFSLDKYRFISYDSRSSLTEYQLRVEINGTYAGFFGKLDKRILSKFEIEQDVFVCELNLEVLAKADQGGKKYSPLPKFPAVRRDLALVVDVDQPNGVIEEALKESGGQLLNSITLFDVYVGGQVGAGKKSLAYALEFQPHDRTYTDREIDGVVGRLLEHVQKRCGAKLRN